MNYFKNLYLTITKTELKASKACLFTIGYSLTDWPKEWKKIILKLALLLLLPIYLVFCIPVFLITLLGFIINIIPIISTIFEVILYFIWYVCVFFAMIMNAYNSDDYVEKLHNYTDK